VEGDALDSTMNPADEKTTGSQNNEKIIDDLIAKVKAKENTFTDEQLDYANKAIKERDYKKLKLIVSTLK
jgi:hypothetical protein